MRRKTLRSMLTFVMVFAMLLTLLPLNALANQADDVVQVTNDVVEEAALSAVPDMPYARFVESPPAFTAAMDPVWESTYAVQINDVVRQMAGSDFPATGVGRILWDADYLYVRVDVLDSSVRVANVTSNQWESDSVEVFVSEPNFRGPNPRDGVIAGQYRVSPNNNRSGEFGNNAWTSEAFHDGPTGGGYTVFFRIPWMNAAVPKIDGTVIGFDFQINDSLTGAGNSARGITVWSARDTGWGSTMDFAELKLWVPEEGPCNIIWELAEDPAVTGALEGATIASAGPMTPQGGTTITARKDVSLTDVYGHPEREKDFPHAIEVTRPAAGDGLLFDPAVLELVPGQVYIWEITGARLGGNHRPAFGTVNAAGVTTIFGTRHDTNYPRSAIVARDAGRGIENFTIRRVITHTEAIANYRIYSVGATNNTQIAGNFMIYNITVSRTNPVVAFESDFSGGPEAGLGAVKYAWNHWVPNPDTAIQIVPDSTAPGEYVARATIGPGVVDMEHGFAVSLPDFPEGAAFRATFVARLVERTFGTHNNFRLRAVSQTQGAINDHNVYGQHNQALTTDWRTFTLTGEFPVGAELLEFQLIRAITPWTGDTWEGIIELGEVKIELLNDPGVTASRHLGLPSQAEAFEGIFEIGNIIDMAPNANFTQHFVEQYSVVTLENAMKPWFMSPVRDVYTFREADKVVDWALENGMDVVGHTLVWHNQSAPWLTAPGTTYLEAQENMRQFIQAVAGHYSGRVVAWDVINEIFRTTTTATWEAGLRFPHDNNGIWVRAYQNETPPGAHYSDFVYDAFRFARRYDPYSILIYNDYNCHHAGKATNMMRMTNALNARWATDVDENPQAKSTYTGTDAEIVQAYLNDGGRLLVEQIGLQSHHNVSRNMNEIRNSIDIYRQAVGVTLAITELDVVATTGGNFGGDYNVDRQYNFIRDIFELYMDNSDIIERVTWWGTSDINSWIWPGNPTLFSRPTFQDPVFRAKPIFHTLIEMGENFVPRVVVNGSEADETGAGRHETGTVVTIDAGSREGYAVSWSVLPTDLVITPDPNNPTRATFTMPRSSVTVTANWVEVTDTTLLSIPAPAPVSGIPFGAARSGPAPITAAWTLGNYLPRQIEIITSEGPKMADVAWVINAESLPNDVYNPALNVPQTFNVSGTVTLPDGVTNILNIPLNVSIQVTVDGGLRADIPWTAVSPTIDSGWDGAAVLYIGERVRRNVNHPAGEPTATAVANVLWGDENLYVRVQVTDGNRVSGAGHEVDGVEVFLSETALRGSQIATDMNQYRLTSANMTSFRWSTPTSALITLETWRQVAVDREDGYDIFLAIPLLYNNGPVVNQTMLLDIMINDATMPHGGRTAEVSWSDGGHNGFSHSRGWGEITLVRDPLLEERHSIIATAGDGGSISPSSLAGRVWVAENSTPSFTFTPHRGFVVDTVTVNGAVIPPAQVVNNTFTFPAVVNSDNSIHVTFRPDPDAVVLPFIVWNDNFASGEFTTAVIIDLGEYRVNTADLNPAMFTVNARNTRLIDGILAFQGTRNITRVYANDEPNVRGYVGPGRNSPDFREGIANGRYLVIEFEFWGLTGGQTTLTGWSSTIQHYTIIPNTPITLANGTILDMTVFEQTDTVNTIIDQFVGYTDNNVRRAVYLHRDDDGEVVQGLPLFIYAPGVNDGGENPQLDQTAPLRGGNAAVALMKRMNDPVRNADGRYDSHIMVIVYTGTGGVNGPPTVANMRAQINRMIEDGLVDPRRVYVTGFSWGGTITNNLVNGNPGFFAAAAPLAAVGGWPNAGNAANNADTPYWAFMHVGEPEAPFQTGLRAFLANALPLMNNVRVTRHDSNETFIWPYDQWTPEQAPPSGAQNWSAHDITAPMYYNPITVRDNDGNVIWTMRPTEQSAALPAWDDDYYDLFDWMFSQILPCPDCGERDCICDGNNVPFTADRPTIADGDVWDNALVLELNLPAQTSLSAMHPAGVPAATAVAELLWDFENLYVRIKVDDNTPFTASGQHTLDSIEFFLAEDNVRGPQGQGWRNQYRIARSGAYSFHTATPTTALIGLDANRRVVQANDEGYTILLSIPLLRDGGPVNMQQMLFDIMINDANAVPQTFPADHIPEVLRGETHHARTRTAQVSWHDIPGLLSPTYGGHMGFQNSHGWGEIRLVGAPPKHYIRTTASFGGSITPVSGVLASSLAGKHWVVPYTTNITSFAITPAIGYQVDTVLINGVPAEPAIPASGGVVTFPIITSDNYTIEVTFAQAAGARELDFIVFNDVFADGEYTTAVIIDLGVGNSIQTASLDPTMFTVSARNTTLSGAVERFVGTRNITRVYANDVPEPIGYLSPPGGTPGTPPASGRYIVIELQFFSPAGGYAYGGQTRSGSNTMALNYSIIANAPIGELGAVVFRQDRVVSPVLDRFVRGTGPQNHSIVLDPAWEGDGPGNRNPLPVFVYHHGGGRAGAALTHPDGCIFAPLRSANGGAMLSKLQLMDPERFGGVHIIVTHGHNAPNTIALLRQLIEEEKVDPDRIYMSGFSAGASTTVNVLRQAPELLAAIVPVGSAERVTQAQVNARPEILDVPVWYIVHLADRGPGGGGSFADNRIRQINTVFDNITYDGRGFVNANLTTLVSNGVIGWPYFGFDFTAHESETAAFGNLLGEMLAHCDIFPATGGRRGPDQEAFAHLHIFDWLFAQSRAQEPELTLTFHLYSANQTILDAFADYAIDEVDGRPAIVVTVDPGAEPTTWDGFEALSRLGHIYGTTDRHGYAFWGWFDDEMLYGSARLRDGLRRPALTVAGECPCLLADLLELIADATAEELLALFEDGNIDLYGVWVRWGDVDDNGLVNMSDLNLLQRHVNFGHVMDVEFSGVAADVVVDGVVNMIDLNLHQRHINFGHLIPVALGARPE